MSASENARVSAINRTYDVTIKIGPFKEIEKNCQNRQFFKKIKPGQRAKISWQILYLELKLESSKTD